MISATQFELASIWNICSGTSSFRFCPQNAPKQTKKPTEQARKLDTI